MKAFYRLVGWLKKTPLATFQMGWAHHQFVHAMESIQRLPDQLSTDNGTSAANSRVEPKDLTAIHPNQAGSFSCIARMVPVKENPGWSFLDLNLPQFKEH
jgi:hypothetical protein